MAGTNPSPLNNKTALGLVNINPTIRGIANAKIKSYDFWTSALNSSILSSAIKLEVRGMITAPKALDILIVITIILVAAVK